MKKSIARQIKGYADVEKKIEQLRSRAMDRSRERGQVRQVIEQLHPRVLNLAVSEILTETSSTKTLRLISTDRPLPPFLAGQYINLFVEIGGIRTSRPYSISSSPGIREYYDITVRQVPDGFTAPFLLEEAKAGDRFQSTSPSGIFHHNPLFHGEDLVFIAGGSGITPFMSMIREVTEKNLPHHIHLIYGSRTEEDIVFKDELSKLAEKHSNLQVTHVITDPSPDYNGCRGFITAELIREQLQGNLDRMYYLCGPEAMYAFVLTALDKLKVPGRKIRREIFGPPGDITAHPGWPEDITAMDRFQVRLPDGTQVMVRAGEPLMNALERHQITLPASCRSGSCSLCRTKLVSGRVFHPAGVQVRRSDRKYGYIHPCMAYALEDLELLL